MRLPLVTLAVAVLVAAFFAGSRMGHGALALKDQPDTIAGELGTDQDGPIVLVPNGDEHDVIWLVFADPRLEALLPAKARPGDRVAARGTLGQGGPFRYLVVASIEKVE